MNADNIRQETLEQEHAKSQAEHQREWEELNAADNNVSDSEENSDDEGVVAAAAEAIANGSHNGSNNTRAAQINMKKTTRSEYKIGPDGRANTPPNSKGKSVGAR